MSTEIVHEGTLYAVLHRAEDWEPGINFVTPGDSFCQVGTWLIPPGRYNAHRHLEAERDNGVTQECVIVVQGALGVTLYDLEGRPFRTVELGPGDFIVTLTGGHGYEILSEGTRVIEAKNGPHLPPDQDKQTLGPVAPVTIG